MIVAGASAYALRIDWQRFPRHRRRGGRSSWWTWRTTRGVAAGIYPTPVGIADFVTSTTHKTLRGPRGGVILGGEHEKAINSSIFRRSRAGR